MGRTSEDTETTVDLLLRADGPAAWKQQQQVIETLDRLDETDAIDGYRTQVWGNAVPLGGPLSETVFYRAAVRKVRAFEEWAESRDGPVELPFERDEVVSELTGDRHSLVRLPMTCLAVYDGADLLAVYPCVEDGEPCSVEDLLERMDAIRGESGDDPTEELPGITRKPG